MKKLLISVLSSAAVLFANAGVVYPIDFQKEFNSEENQLEGWTIYAPEGEPVGDIARLFPNYSPDNGVQILFGNVFGAWSPSQFSNGQMSDTWLITPEFEVNYDNEVLAFGVSVFGMSSKITNNFSVYVSEGGTAKEDFTKFQSGTLSGSAGGAGYVNDGSFRYALSDYKGKKIRLAFVNEGNQAGMLGFDNISLGSWYGTLTDKSQYYNNIILGANNSMDEALKISTPQKAAGYKLEFKTSGGFTYSENNESRNLSINSVSNLLLSIPDITLANDVEEYTLTFTPNFEGAGSMVVSGNILKVEREYDNVAVLEEATGTWCIWCPYGAAALAYYSDLYTGEDGTNKVIPIAIHGDDPMQISADVSDYYFSWMENVGTGGFPAIAVNRQKTVTPSPNPKVVGNQLTTLFKNKSYAKAELKNVYFYNDEMWADYDLTTSFTAPEGMLAASAILTENNVQGMNSSYSQQSCVSQNGDNAATIKSRLGEDWVPYFEPYFGVTEVSYKNIQYPHVARGAFPSFEGKPIPEMVKGDVYNGRVHFTMPSTVKVQENTSVVIVIRNTSTGEIVAADEVVYDDYTFESSVEEISDLGNISASIENGQLRVEVEEDAVVKVYGIDGVCLISADAETGVNTFPLNKANNIVIVNVKTANGNRQFKLFNR